MWTSLTTALSFLTIFRLPWSSAGELTALDLGRSFSWFPCIGLLLGGCSVALVMALSQFMPSLLLAAFATTLMAILTRALHLDGLADLADGLGGGYTPERRLEIMKDSRTGAFGALALALAVLLKVVALYAIILQNAFAPIVLAPVLGRYAMTLAAYGSPYARKEPGLGKPFLEGMTVRELTISSLLAIGFSLALVQREAIVYLTAAICVVALMRCLTRRTLGGITGDVLGATNEITEIIVLSIAACLATR